jgi:hypothetical protein
MKFGEGFDWEKNNKTHAEPREVVVGQYTWLIDQNAWLATVGSWQEDAKWILSVELRQARENARQWLSQQPDAFLMELSLEATTNKWLGMVNYKEAIETCSDSYDLDKEMDAFNQAFDKSVRLKYDYWRQIDQEHLKELEGCK